MAGEALRVLEDISRRSVGVRYMITRDGDIKPFRRTYDRILSGLMRDPDVKEALMDRFVASGGVNADISQALRAAVHLERGVRARISVVLRMISETGAMVPWFESDIPLTPTDCASIGLRIYIKAQGKDGRALTVAGNALVLTGDPRYSALGNRIISYAHRYSQREVPEGLPLEELDAFDMETSEEGLAGIVKFVDLLPSDPYEGITLDVDGMSGFGLDSLISTRRRSLRLDGEDGQ